MRKAIALIPLLLAGCAGSNGPDANVSGVAAIGAPLANATITLKCIGGSQTTTAGEDGVWAAYVEPGAFPCAARAVSSDGSMVLHSMQEQPGTLNITPLTELMVAAHARTMRPSEWFDRVDPAASIGVGSALTTAASVLRVLPPAVVDRLGSVGGGANPISTPFTATPGDSLDQALETLSAEGFTPNDDKTWHAALAATVVQRPMQGFRCSLPADLVDRGSVVGSVESCEGGNLRPVLFVVANPGTTIDWFDAQIVFAGNASPTPLGATASGYRALILYTGDEATVPHGIPLDSSTEFVNNVPPVSLGGESATQLAIQRWSYDDGAGFRAVALSNGHGTLVQFHYFEEDGYGGRSFRR